MSTHAGEAFGIAYLTSCIAWHYFLCQCMHGGTGKSERIRNAHNMNTVLVIGGFARRNESIMDRVVGVGI